MEDSLRAYCAEHRFRLVERGRRGQHESDWEFVTEDGTVYPVEEKRIKETQSSTSSWWSFWRNRLSENYEHDAVSALSTNVRGWLAVVDGELRDWCAQNGTDTGYLAVEAASSTLANSSESIEAELDTALKFLRNASRIAEYEPESLDDDEDVLLVKITY